MYVVENVVKTFSYIFSIFNLPIFSHFHRKVVKFRVRRIGRRGAEGISLFFSTRVACLPGYNGVYEERILMLLARSYQNYTARCIHT